MALRGIVACALGWCVLVLLVTSANAAGPFSKGPPSKNKVDLDLPREERQARNLEELLGRDRLRRLNEANFWIAVHDHGFTPKLSDIPDQHEELSGILLSSLGRISHKAVLNTLRLEERRDELRGKLGGGGSDADSDRFKLRTSPRFRFDGDAWVGAKLRLSGTRSKLLSGTSLRIGSEFDGHNPSVKFGYEDRSRRASITYYGDHRERGEFVELLVGFSF